MTLEQIKEIFKYQLTASEGYTPPDVLDYMLFSDSDRIPGTCAVDKIETLITLLENYTHEGYRDRMPLFVKIPIDL